MVLTKKSLLCEELEKTHEISLSYKLVGDALKNKSGLLQVSGSRPHQKRVRALVDCRAVSSEQLTFFKDEIIVVTATSDPHWWVSATTTSGLHNCAMSVSPLGSNIKRFNVKCNNTLHVFTS